MKGSGVDILEQALKFDFRASDNQVKYETLIVDLNLAKRSWSKKA